ncbi:nucleoside-diphosphate-sugar epimerase [Tamilnaduibacter salinus]|nr:NAD-dependent epimerase/dehydratase family protein [Tamilnaduibacter salinus]PVY70836.1 nucleoside-diphosphate-sugar epimerase [Tamilnaduibacter salinus]
MKVLVTGSSGFVGRHVCRMIRSERPDTQLLRAVRTPTSDERDDEITVGEIGEGTNWADAVAGQDVVIHLAASAHNLSRDLDEVHQVNGLGTKRLAVQASEAGVKRFIFISSVGVSGASTRGRSPFIADENPEPHGAYARSKFWAEEALRDAGAFSDMEIVIVRPPLVYGPGAPGNFDRLARWVRNGIPLPLGTVRNKRSFISVYNLADVIVRCLDHPNAVGKVFLVKDGEDLSTTDFIRRIGNAMGRKPRLMPFPVSVLRTILVATGQKNAAQSLLDSLVVDGVDVEEALGWVPPYSVEESLRRCFL